MSRPFDVLRGELLAAGVGPSQARRYLAELADHLEDLAAEEVSAGRSPDEARTAARARLGADDALAQAMILPGRFRSWTARAPWVVLPLTGLGVLAVSYGLTTVLMVLAVAELATLVAGHPMPPAWLPPLADRIFTAVRFLSPVAAGWVVGMLALRQRLDSRWIAVTLIGIAAVGAGLYCRADWPVTARPWSFQVGSQLDDTAPALSWGAYAAVVLASLLASWLPYAALRRKLPA